MFLSVEKATKAYGKSVVLSGIDLLVNEGEIVAVIGPNGSGKSTLFGLISGDKLPTSGKIEFRNKNVTRLAAHRRIRMGLGRTFQVTSIFSSRSVRENVQTALFVAHGLNNRFLRLANITLREEAKAILNDVGLFKERELMAASLSHGDKKLLDFAIALACDPKLLMLDEPTQGMAHNERHRLIDLILKISQKKKVTVLFTEHDMDVVFGFATRIAVLNQGKKIFDGTPAEAKANAEIKRVYLKESL